MDNQIKQDAIFSKDRKYRYVLTRIWDESKPMVAFVGLNPSIADDKQDDSTIKKCIKFANSWGYGGFYMLNLFALVSTNPNALFESKDPTGSENDKYISEYTNKTDKVVCAWGNNGAFMQRSAAVSKKISNKYCIKLNKTGEPAHPLYLKNDSVPTKF